MLFFVSRQKPTGGFRLRRRARRGLLPPAVRALPLCGYWAARLEFFGPSPAEETPYLTPYRQRGDVLVAAQTVAAAPAFNAPLVAEYARRQCANFCLRALAAAEQRRRASVVLVDEAGLCPGVAAELVAACTAVTVVTAHPERYEACRRYTRGRYGSEPVVSRWQAPPADLVLAPYGCGGWTPPPGKPVAAPDGSLFPAAGQLVVPGELPRQLPADTDPEAAAAGLLAAFRPQELMRAAPDRLTFRGRPVTPTELLP